MTTDWRRVLREIEPKARMTAPATEADVAEAEQAVGAVFPADLRDLFLQTDGILDDGYGPVLPLSGKRPAPFSDSSGNTAPSARFPAHNYSVIQYTLLQRSLWDDVGVSHNSFVVIGVDIGGNPFGFFSRPAETVTIKSIAHDEGSIDDNDYSLEDYLRFYFANCRWFTNEV